jgi:mRNA interferase RelE/StbE
MKSVSYTRTAARALLRHANRAAPIRSKINAYAKNPASQANNVKQLSGSAAMRLRVGDFRVLFIETGTALTILDVGPRGDIYD